MFVVVGSERDFVRVYDFYVFKRLDDLKISDSLFYLVINYIIKIVNIKFWFKLVSMGVNKIKLFMKIMVEKVGLDVKNFINYSGRKRLI